MVYPGEQIVCPQKNPGCQSEKIRMSIEVYPI